MNFDLNISNYSKKELEEIFELPINYDEDNIEEKEQNLRSSISSDKTISEKTRIETTNFLNEAKNVLLNDLISSNKIIHKSYSYHLDNQFIPDPIYPLLKDSPLLQTGDHFIIDQSKIKASETNYSERDHYPGIRNPLRIRTFTNYLTIDSRFRENYYSTISTDYQFNLPIKLTIEMPTTYYVISKQLGNNYFTITLSSGNSYVITIPNGNYNELSLVSYFNNYCQNIVPALNTINFILNIDNNQSGSGQLIISSSSNFILNFQNDIYGNPDTNNPLPLKIGWLLGFRNGIYTGNMNYVSEGLMNLSGPSYFYLVIDDYNNNVNQLVYAAFTNSFLNKNILARFTFPPSPLGYLTIDNADSQTSAREYMGPVDITKMHIQLLDGYGRIVQLNNMDFSFSLKFINAYDI